VRLILELEFAKIAQALDRNLRQVPLINIQAQFRVLLDSLVEETSSLSLKEVKELDSKELIRKFLMKPDLYYMI
jgi:hypothetical protein